MDSGICRVNAGVGAVKDYLLERQNKHTYFFEQLYSTQGSIGTQEILTLNLQ